MQGTYGLTARNGTALTVRKVFHERMGSTCMGRDIGYAHAFVCIVGSVWAGLGSSDKVFSFADTACFVCCVWFFLQIQVHAWRHPFGPREPTVSGPNGHVSISFAVSYLNPNLKFFILSASLISFDLTVGATVFVPL